MQGELIVIRIATVKWQKVQKLSIEFDTQEQIRISKSCVLIARQGINV